VLTAKLRRLLKQAVLLVILLMLVMQVIDETNNAAPCFVGRANWPQINADERRWNEKLCYLRSSAFICGQFQLQGLQTDGQHLTPSSRT
jgi:hypothetical protein